MHIEPVIRLPDATEREEAEPTVDWREGPPPEELERPSFFARASRVLLWLGLLIVLFVGFELIGGALLHTEDQGRLLSEFKTLVASGRGSGTSWNPTPGQPIAQLIIPAIGVREVVVQDTTPELTKGGPGHFLITPLPGHPGNVVIAGRRVTYGAVFRHLGDLSPGDHIAVITPQGAFDYAVTGAPTIVRSGQPDVLANTTTPQLTLVTSDAASATRGRLAVTAALQGTPLEPAATPVVALTNAQLGLSGDSGAVVVVIPWTLALVVALIGLRVLRRFWSGRLVALVAAPVLVVILFFLFTNVDRLLPSTI
jgi:sortase A